MEDFHWEQALGKSAQMTVDGHALVGTHDYFFKFDLTDEKLGYIRAGYTEFRTWYDGNGGYYPPTRTRFPCMTTISRSIVAAGGLRPV